MATNKILQDYGTQLSFADHATDFDNGTPSLPATAANSLIIGTPTEVQMNMGVIAPAAAWQSAKTATLADTAAHWPIEWTLGACMESTATPVAGGSFDFFWNASPSATAGTGNSGLASGLDATFAIAGLDQLIYIGSLTVRVAVINIDSNIGVLNTRYLYGSLIVVNNTSVAMVADNDADEIHVVLTPNISHIQAAA